MSFIKNILKTKILQGVTHKTVLSLERIVLRVMFIPRDPIPVPLTSIVTASCRNFLFALYNRGALRLFYGLTKGSLNNPRDYPAVNRPDKTTL